MAVFRLQGPVNLLAQVVENLARGFCDRHIFQMTRPWQANQEFPLYSSRTEGKQHHTISQSHRFAYVMRHEDNGASSFRPDALQFRSEERRVGKECRSRWSPYH